MGGPVPFNEFILPAFPINALPEPLQSYVVALAQATQTPFDLAGMLVLAVCSCALARKVVVCIRPGYIDDIPHREPDLEAFLSIKPGIPLSQELEQVQVLVSQMEHHESFIGARQQARGQVANENRIKAQQRSVAHSGIFAICRNAVMLARPRVRRLFAAERHHASPAH
jgi:hypothetical protein